MYLNFGSRLVVVVDPQKRTVEMHEPHGERVFTDPEIATCENYADLAIDTANLFRNL
jgi:hypothetical protein